MRIEVRGFSVPGANHVVSGHGNQDAWHQLSNGRATVIAVADGAGSRPRSAIGAAVASQEATTAAVARLGTSIPEDAPAWQRLLVEVTLRTRTRLLAVAASLELAPAELGTTLTICVLAEGWCAALRVGDGFIAARRVRDAGEPDYSLLLPPPPDATDEDFPTATRFLSGTEIPELLGAVPDAIDPHVVAVVERVPDLDGLLIGTDGLIPAVVDLSADPPRAHEGFLAPILDAVGERYGYDVMDVLVNQLHHTGGDDKTAVIATVRQEGNR